MLTLDGKGVEAHKTHLFVLVCWESGAGSVLPAL